MTTSELINWLETYPRVQWSIDGRTCTGTVQKVMVEVVRYGPLIERIDYVEVFVPREHGTHSVRRFLSSAIESLKPIKEGS